MKKFDAKTVGNVPTMSSDLVDKNFNFPESDTVQDPSGGVIRWIILAWGIVLIGIVILVVLSLT